MRLRKQPKSQAKESFFNSLESPKESLSSKESEGYTKLLAFGVIVVVVLTISYLKVIAPVIEEPLKPIVNVNFDPDSLKSWQSPAPLKSKPGSPGDMGKPVTLSGDKLEESKKRFEEHHFDVVISDMIPTSRSLIDARHPKCILRSYPEKLPDVAVIIVFHNEAWSTLSRTLWSIISQSPKSLLKELILVDDASEMEHLGEALDSYVSELPVKTTIVRNENRIGLIRARLRGVEVSTAQVIAFLDAHCECTQGWLPPLLSRIMQNRQTVVSPIIDVISDTTFEYKKVSEGFYGGFDANVAFKWQKIPKEEQQRRNHDESEPIRTPTIAGGLFAMDREYFYELGSYDEGMEIWGAENLELSFRVWTCGGVLEIVPCSRVGHIFRKKTPYSFVRTTTDIIQHNTARLAEVWMDEYKEFYLKGKQNLYFGDVSARKALRKKLKCRSFRWFLENIYKEGPFPDLTHFGEGNESTSEEGLENARIPSMRIFTLDARIQIPEPSTIYWLE